MTGCEFARLLPGKAGRVAVELHVDADLAPTDWLNSAFDEHAKSDRVVIAVFPRITTEVGFVEFLNTLGTDARWALARSCASRVAVVELDGRLVMVRQSQHSSL
jgi:hypothetical protein